MKDVISRRSVLTSMGLAAAYGTAATQLQSVARAADAAAPAAPQETILTMLFMAGAKSKFDVKKYTAKHLPLLKKSYGDSVSRIELRTSFGDARDIPSDILATTTIYISDLGGFVGKMSSSAPEINKDLEDSSKGTVLVQVDRLLLAIGDARSEVRENHQVFSTFYRGKPDATFDTAYFTETHIPKLMSLYGNSAIRRIEVNLGLPQGGQKPAMIAAYHMFIRERSAFDAADRSATPELMKNDPKYTNTTPAWADLKVIAIA